MRAQKIADLCCKLGVLYYDVGVDVDVVALWRRKSQSTKQQIIMRGNTHGNNKVGLGLALRLKPPTRRIKYIST